MAKVHGTLGSDGDTLSPQPVCEECQTSSRGVSVQRLSQAIQELLVSHSLSPIHAQVRSNQRAKAVAQQ